MRSTTFAALALFALPTAAELRLPAILGDHMVVQRDATTRVWGWAGPGDAVSVRASWGAAGDATAAADGAWSVELATPAAGGPFTITVSSAGDERVLADVLAGDVWLCGGQSNMEWPLHNTEHGEEDVAAASHPNLRLFDVARAMETAERDDCDGSWSACTPDTARDFSAVGYLFGSRLHTELGVPIGLIGSNWGGTPAEAWTSKGTLQVGFPEFHADLSAMADLEAGVGDGQTLEQLRAAFWAKVDASDPGMTGGWTAAELDTSAWKPAKVPGAWSDFGEGAWDGCLWYRTTVDLPASWAGAELVLELGPIDDMDTAWLNGERIGASRSDGMWNTPRRYAIPAGLAKAGGNSVVVCAVDSGGAGRLGSEGGQRLVRADATGGGPGAVPLDGDWVYRRGASLSDLGGFPRQAWLTPHRPSSLFNGMIAPLLGHAIKGAIWYQGESNRGRHEQYRRLFPAMITDWRTRFDAPDFPFYFVQLAPFGYGGDTGELSLIREAQALTLALPNTGMAVTMDVGNPGDIHPRDKRTVGERLARLALAKTYGKDVACEGPTFVGMDRAKRGLEPPHPSDRGLLVLHFEHADGLTSRLVPLRHFTVAGADRVFHPAIAEIRDGDVVVWSESVVEPVAVRYCWGATDASNLWNAAGLPTPSFRSDDWPK